MVADIFKHIIHKSWHPDDYILTSEKSACSKDREDTQRLQDYLKEINYFDKIKSLKNNRFLEAHQGVGQLDID